MLKWLRKGMAEITWSCAMAVAAGLAVGAGSPVGAMASEAPGLGATGAATADSRTAVEVYLRSRSHAVAAAGWSTATSGNGVAIPAFARKYGLRCSACHTAWPQLNSFGQKFKDNGFQLGNDRDSPIWVNPSYWPASVRTTAQWRLERTTNQPVDAVPGDPFSGTVENAVTQSGFDIGGADLLMLGTLYKNITFGFVPTLADAELGIETAFVRFDNLFNSSWANLKVGKFELDNLLSEKRIVTLSNNGGLYQSYHFVPVGDATDFGLGDNQIGAELMGHSANSYSRFSVAVLDATDGTPGISAGRSYDGMVTFSQAFDGGKLGVQRVGLYGYVGQRPTVFATSGGEPIAGSGTFNKVFYRIGVLGDFSLGKLEFLPFYLHGSDNRYLATDTPGDQALPAGARNATWNSGLLETHYYINPQFLLTQRTELIRMSNQALSSTPKTLGDVDAYTFGSRWYPIMISRAGLAVVGELAFTKTTGTVPSSGDGVGLPPLLPSTEVWSTSALLALDFDF
jgi:hypothetical protein